MLVKRIQNKTHLYWLFFVASFFLSAWANINVGVVFEPIKIFGGEFTLTGGDLFFPVVYIINDLAADFFGKKNAIKISVYSAILFTALSVITWATSFFPTVTPEFAAATRTVFSFTPRAAIASLFALFIGTTLNANIFEKMKLAGAGFKLRAWVSTMVGELGDSVLVSILMFYGTLPNKTILSMIITQYILKLFVEGILVTHTEGLAKKIHLQIGE